jgi:orotidine-5'-phosphate decarboxylase
MRVPHGPPPSPLCVALDGTDARACERVAARVAEHAGVLKVGSTSFVAGGPGLVRRLARLRPVFLDLKLHDIPAQVAGAVEGAASLGASYATVHAAGGAAMVKAAVASGGDEVAVLAVTLLTSLDAGDLGALGVVGSARAQVFRLADLALGGGVAGLVCSSLEAAELRKRFGARADGGPLLVVPGVRPTGVEADDQRRTATPAAAVGAGADVIVVGRPITAATDPASAAQRIAAEATIGRQGRMT